MRIFKQTLFKQADKAIMSAPSFNLSRSLSSHLGVGIGATIVILAQDKLMGAGTMTVNAAVYGGVVAGVLGSVLSDVLIEKPLMGLLNR